MKKLLSILGSIGMVGTASVTSYSFMDGGSTNQALPPLQSPRQELLILIKDAQLLVNIGEKVESAVEALKLAINQAQVVADNESSTNDELNQAIINLSAAIVKYQKALPNSEVEKARKALIRAIEALQTLVAKEEKIEWAVEALKLAINQAQKVVDNPKASAALLKKTLYDLSEAARIYQESPNRESVEEARKELQGKIREAQGLVDEQEKVVSAVEALKLAINQAQEVVDSSQATLVQLKQAIVDLSQAIEQYKAAQDWWTTEARQALKAKIEEAWSLISEAEKEGRDLPSLRKAHAEATHIYHDKSASEAQLEEATQKLDQAIKEVRK